MRTVALVVVLVVAFVLGMLAAGMGGERVLDSGPNPVVPAATTAG